MIAVAATGRHHLLLLLRHARLPRTLRLNKEHNMSKSIAPWCAVGLVGSALLIGAGCTKKSARMSAETPPGDTPTRANLEPSHLHRPVTQTVLPATQQEPTPAPPILSPSLVLDLGDNIKLELVLVKKGKFLMGVPRDDARFHNAKPQHRVTISKDFYLGKYVVTQQQYQKIMNTNPSDFSKTGARKDAVAALKTERFPVENVTWTEAEAFCTRVSKLTRKRVELPTEAQWEFACRAGTTTWYYWGDEVTDKEANVERQVNRPTEVGRYPANPWGLYDMTGNVSQWCADGMRNYALADDNCTDPIETDPVGFAVRGGSWSTNTIFCRSACRNAYMPSHHSNSIGFRVLVRLD
jgi:formylglycine-generating enzyme required for sulfatase activity